MAYGERWRCERCGRSWDTQQIPAEEYEGLLRRMRRARSKRSRSRRLIAAVLVPLIVFVDARFIFVVPLVLARLALPLSPVLAAKIRRAARDAPRWELHPSRHARR